MLCPRCGWENPDDSSFCTRCGAPFEDAGRKEETGEEGKEAPRRCFARREVFLAAAVVLLIIGEILLNAGIRNARYSSYIAEAEEAVLQEEWALAGRSYNKALRLRPHSQELTDEIHELWLKVQLISAECCVDGRFQEAVEAARNLREIEPGNEIGNLSAMRSAYLTWVLELAEQGSEQETGKVIELASEDLPEEDIRDIRDYAELLSQIAGLRRDIAQGLRPMLDHSFGPDSVSVRAMDTVRTIILDLMDKLESYDELGGWFPVVAAESADGPAAGIWFDGYGGFQIYLGTMDADMVRQETGENWFVQDLGGEEEIWEYAYCLGWRDDIPCGEFLRISCGADGRILRRMRGQLVDGRYDGDIETFWEDGETYTLTFEEGKIKVLSETAPDGSGALIVGYSSDGKKWISLSPEETERIYGIRYIY